MTTAYTSLLGLALPVQGELAGTWGDTVNNYITSYVDAAVAGAQTVSSDTSPTLTKTTGASLDATSSQYAIINCTGARTALRTITVPAASKFYLVINGTTGGYGVKIVGAGPTTGVTIANGKAALIAWNGSDFVTVASNDASVITGILAVANGGTGLSSGTSGGVPYFSGSTTIASSAALTANALVVGGGAGAAPSTVTTGTGVVTALGVNTGTAGAFVVNGGALGTPSSGTVTNLTGTASININGTVGATTPTTGAFTSVTATNASGVLSRVAATQDGVAIVGRAGGTSSYTATLTPTTLSASRTLTIPNVTDTLATIGTAQTFTAAQTFRAASAVRSEAASTQDAMVLAGRAGGTGSYAVTLTPTTLSASRTATFPDAATSIPVMTQTLTFSGPTAARTITFPDANFTAARTDAANTFTGTQTVLAAATQDAVAIAGRAGGTGNYIATITPTTLSASRTVTLPDASTTVPVATQVLTFSGPTAARTITFPDANFTAARTDAANTFTGTQTFSGSVVPATLTVDSVGYTGTPLNEQSAAYTLVAGDAGKSIVHPASDNNARTFTIPANGSVAFPVGTTITFINMINTVTIAITTDTMYLAGAGTTGSRTLAAYGMATAIKMTSTTWIISGNGLT